jgi:transcriptional pleiotropic regulator of transition state genes
VRPIGTARRIDQLGRVVVPVELRRLLGLRDGDLLDISADGDRLVLRRIEPSCTFCGADDRLHEHHGKLVCAGCRRELARVTD